MMLKIKTLILRGFLVGLFCCVTNDSPSVAEEADLLCMAEAIYFESRGEPEIGQLAVGITIKNRFKHPDYPDSICGVVRQGRYWQGVPLRDRCQFSYWCDGRPERIEDDEAWTTALGLAELVLSTSLEIKGLEGVTHFHSTKVKPVWSSQLLYKSTVGSHLFYVKKRSGVQKVRLGS